MFTPASVGCRCPLKRAAVVFFEGLLYLLRRAHLQVVAGAGAINHQELVDLAGKSFANLPTTPTTAEELVKKVCSKPCDLNPC